ncbi:hypothetical protein [Pandoraea fibrosis]|nr:hypothetical protein [Pandoraea fibrosis]
MLTRRSILALRRAKTTGMAALTASLACAIGLAACTTRPFQPAPPLFQLWAKPGVAESGVRSALLACGFPDSAYVGSEDMTTNAYAAGELCMIDRGFAYQDQRILCATQPRLPACANVPRGKTFGTAPDFDPKAVKAREPLPPAYTYWRRPGEDVDTVKREMTACGYTELSTPSDVMMLNDIAAAQLCMLDKGFQYGWPYQALLCKTQPSLPACRGKSIDTQHCCTPARPAGAK